MAAVKWLDKRKDVDHGASPSRATAREASSAMLAAAREKKISSLVLMAGMGTPRRELILEQQQQLLSAHEVLPESERAEESTLQNKILDAASRRKAGRRIPPEMRAARTLPRSAASDVRPCGAS